MKSVRLVFVLTIVLMFTQVKSQTILVSGRFLNSNDMGVPADYKLNCEGKTVHSGQSTEKLELSLSLNKTYVLIVSNKDFKTKTIFFSIKPELNHDEYFFEFDVHLEERNSLRNTEPKNETVKFNYNVDPNNATADSSHPEKI